MVRRPPISEVLAAAHDMSREHRIISALAGSSVPVPTALGLCMDEDVNERPFYVMDDPQRRRPGARCPGLGALHLGDPLADVGHLLAYWVERGEPGDLVLSSATGATDLPTRAELAALYTEHEATEWFAKMVTGPAARACDILSQLSSLPP